MSDEPKTIATMLPSGAIVQMRINENAQSSLAAPVGSALYPYPVCQVCGWKPWHWIHGGKFRRHGYRKVKGKWTAPCQGSGMDITYPKLEPDFNLCDTPAQLEGAGKGW